MEARNGFIPMPNQFWIRWQKYPDACKSNFRLLRAHIFHDTYPNAFCLTMYGCKKIAEGALAPHNTISCLGTCTGIHPCPAANLAQLTLFQSPPQKPVPSTRGTPASTGQPGTPDPASCIRSLPSPSAASSPSLGKQTLGTDCCS